MSCEVMRDAPAVRTGYGLLCKYWESNRQVPRVGEEVGPWPRQTGTFSEVNFHEVIVPVGNGSSSPLPAAQNPLQEQKGQRVDP